MKNIIVPGLLLLCLFFYGQIFLGEVVYCCDNFLINIPSKVFLIEELRQGRFPIWNPYIFSGTPFFADINNALLYPLNMLYAFLNPFRALMWIVILNFLIAMVGMYVFARSILLPRFGSFVAAMVFAFSGTMVVYTNNVPMIQVASLLPWLIWSVNRYLANPGGVTLGLAAVIATLQIIAGHPQLTFYSWLFVFSYSIWHYGRKSLYLIPLLILTGLLSSVQLLPFMEFVRDSTRIGRDYTYATFDSLNPFAVARLIAPPLSGDLSRGFAYFFGGSVYGYVGVIALLLAVFAKRKEKTVRFFLICAVFSFLLALGKYSPVYTIAYYLIPGVGSFRSPQHFLLLYTFSVAILAGYGIRRFIRIRYLLALLVGFELFAFSRNNLLTVPEQQTENWMKTGKQTAQQFANIDRQSERIFVDQGIFRYPDARGWPFVDLPAETEWQAQILRPNLNMLYRLPSIDGYTSLVLLEYQQNVAPDSTDPTGINLQNVSSDTFQKLGVRFFLTKGPDGKPAMQEFADWHPQNAPHKTVPKSVQLGLFLSLIGFVAAMVVGFTWKGETKRSENI